MKNNITAIIGTFLLLLMMGCNAPQNNANQKNDSAPSIAQKGYSTFPLPDSLTIFGEEIPLHKEWARRALDLELTKNTFWHSNTLLMIKKSKLYFPVMDSVLKAENMPLDFKYLSAAESNLNPTIVSPAKAKGFWQFLAGTAKDMGLEVNNNIDERSHLIKSTFAATKYLKILKDSTKSWTLAAASYNAGLGNIRKAIKQQYPNHKASYFDLDLFSETERYVFRIAALKLILSQPQKYGFEVSEDYTSSGKLVKQQETIPDIYAWCRKNNVSIREFRFLNPWIIGDALPNPNGKVYQLKLPNK